MDVSIIIVSFNTKELLADCLKSAKAANSNLKAELFVVDNNSTDGSADMVKKDFPNVNLIANHENVGFSSANNQALVQAKGKYLLILNPDTKLMPQTLKIMKSYMDKNPNVAVSTCRVELPNGQLDIDCRRHFPTPWRAFCHFSHLSKIFKGSKLFDQYNMGYLSDAKEHEIDSCVGAFMFIRRESAEKVGYFDEDFFFYGEDLDWCWRFREYGYKITYNPATKIIHYKGVSSGIKKISKHLTLATRSSRRKAILESTRAMELFYKKHYFQKYPFFIDKLIIATIKVLTVLRLAIL